MRPPALGAVSGGIRYQVRFFWRQALPMLYPQSKVARVVLEHRDVDAVDDVVVYYGPPGVNDRGATVDVDFFQLKFHVAQSGAVDHAAVADPKWTDTKLPILRRFAGAWQGIRTQHAGARLSLVTNWAWHPECPLAPLLRDGGVLADDFFSAGARSDVGKIRAQWVLASALPPEEFEAFARRLRFSTSAVSQADAELWLNDRCQLAGLVPPDLSQDHSAYDDLGARLIESGRTEHTPESLRALVEKEGLVASEPPFRSTFAVRSFTRFAHLAATDGECSIDLTDLFEGRLVRDVESWTTAIPERLAAALPAVVQLPVPVHVALDTHLSIAWLLGFLLDPKAAIPLVLRQRTRTGIEIWDVSSAAAPADTSTWAIELDEEGDGDELAVVVSVTHSALADATRFVRASLPSVRGILHASVPNFGPTAVKDGAHARWLADALIGEVNRHAATLRPKRIHVFPACPVAIAFLAGQGTRALGATTVYEFDFGDPNRGYRAGTSMQEGT